MVQGMAFLSKKSFNPTNLSNQKRVWEVEQKKAAEDAKAQELAREIAQEREREEFDRITNQNGVVLDRGIDWMYQGQAADSEIAQADAAKRAEEYLLGKEYRPEVKFVKQSTLQGDPNEGVNKVLKQAAAVAESSPPLNNNYYGPSATDSVDQPEASVAERNEAFRMRHEDPMFFVSQQAQSFEKKMALQYQLKHGGTAVVALPRTTGNASSGITPGKEKADFQSAAMESHEQRSNRASSSNDRRDRKRRQRDESDNSSDEYEKRKHKKRSKDSKKSKASKKRRSRDRRSYYSDVDSSRSRRRHKSSRRRSPSESESSTTDGSDDSTKASRGSGRNDHRRREYSSRKRDDESRRRSKHYSKADDVSPRVRDSSYRPSTSRRRSHSPDSREAHYRHGDSDPNRGGKGRRDEKEPPDDVLRRHSADRSEPSSRSGGIAADSSSNQRPSRAAERDLSGDGYAQPKKPGYGLLDQHGLTRSSAVGQSSYLGPDPELLRRKREAKEQERKRVQEEASVRRYRTPEERSAALRAMEADAAARAEYRSKVSVMKVLGGDDIDEGNGTHKRDQPDFLRQIARSAHGVDGNSSGTTMEARIRQNRNHQQRAHESFL
jgi:N-terminal domain of CBF1 interacting co-repressor CIR/Pre-mRNA splicing factor